MIWDKAGGRTELDLGAGDASPPPRAVGISCVAMAAHHRLLIERAMGEGVPADQQAQGTATMDEERIASLVREVFPLKPAGLVKELDLLKPIYRKTAAFGHFGREEFSWEKTDKVSALKRASAA